MFHFSVRELSRPIEPEGSLDHLSGLARLQLSGQKIHQQIQTRLKEEFNDEYQSEVHLKKELIVDGYEVTIAGRVDGVFYFKQSEIVIEEIKSTNRLDSLVNTLNENPDHPYLMQLKIYSHLFESENKIVGSCKSRLRLVSPLEDREFLLELNFEPEEFSDKLHNRLKERVQRAVDWAERQRLRKKVGTNLLFPFDKYREGQKHLIEEIDALENVGDQILVQAPCGLGKTMGSLYPVLKQAFLTGKNVVFLTPKNSQHQVALDALIQFQKREVPITSLIITAKRKACLKEEPLCTPEHCEYADQYYTKVKKHRLREKLKEYPNLTIDVLQNIGQTYEVCPFELSLDGIAQRDLVICDYNYIFSPRSQLAELLVDDQFSGKGNFLVIDEVHNLGHRVRDYFSPELKVDFLQSMFDRSDEVPKFLQTAFKAAVSDCIQSILSHDSEDEKSDRFITSLNLDILKDCDSLLRAFASRYYEAITELGRGDVVYTLLLYWSEFFSIIDLLEDNYYVTYRRDEKGDSLKITCCEISEHIRPLLRNFSKVVAISATLKPFEYYQRTTGFSKSSKLLEIESPFTQSNRKIMIIPQASTRYSQREKNYSKIAEIIQKTFNQNPGNYFAFFPSFQFLNRVLDNLKDFKFEILVHYRGIDNAGRQEIEANIRDIDTPKLLMTVQGSIFSEGVDFPGQQIIGAFVVGPGLSFFEFETQLLKDFYQKRYKKGFEYTYLYPAMARVIQSAGRVIRTETDKGLIILIDDRFLNEEYFNTMPNDWFDKHPSELVSKHILKDIEDFWRGHDITSPDK